MGKASRNNPFNSFPEITRQRLSALRGVVSSQGAGDYTLDPSSDHTIEITAVTAGGDTYTLPAGASPGQTFVLIDANGKASADNITVEAENSITINGASSFTISTDYGSSVFRFSGTSYFASTSVGGGGGGTSVTYWETVTVWTLISGNEYYADVNHAFGTKDVFVVTRDSTNDEWVDTGIDAIDTNNVRILVTGNSHSIRVGVTTGMDSTTQVTTLSSWTLISGNEYYADFAHNLGSDDVRVLLYETTTKEDVDAVVERTDTNTVRVKVTGNTHSIRTTVKL